MVQLLQIEGFEPSLQKKEDKLYIFDPVRRKYVLLAPEEWVRQLLLFHLQNLGYSKALISVERGLTYEKKKKRTDIVVYDKEGHPKILVECKAMHIPIDEKVMEQILVYHAQIKAEILILTNGVDVIIGKISETQNMQFLESIPPAF